MHGRVKRAMITELVTRVPYTRQQQKTPGGCPGFELGGESPKGGSVKMYADATRGNLALHRARSMSARRYAGILASSSLGSRST